MTRIAYTRPDGGVSILIPADQQQLAFILANRGQLELAATILNYTAEEYLAWIRAKDVPADATNVTVLDAADIPQGETQDYALVDSGVPVLRPVSVRAFRDCWRLDGNKLVVDPALENAARWRRVRALRNTLLTQSDGPMMREIETNGPRRAAGAAYRQLLRDVPTQPDPKSIAWPANVFTSG